MDKPKYNSKKWIIGFACLTPIILFADIKLFSYIMELIRESSDMAVVLGVVLISSAGFLNYLLIQLIITKTKSK